LNARQCTNIDLDQLIELFYLPADQAERLGVFHLCSATELPPPAQKLLAHDHHMTVTMEEAIAASVDLRVLATQVTGDSYARKILLLDQTNGQPVMFGIVRIDLGRLDGNIQQEITAGNVPLGRVLIASDVLRQVHWVHLYRIDPGSELLQVFLDAPRDRPPTETDPSDKMFFGRTALIFLNEHPVVELLEIVAV